MDQNLLQQPNNQEPVLILTRKGMHTITTMIFIIAVTCVCALAFSFTETGRIKISFRNLSPFRLFGEERSPTTQSLRAAVLGYRHAVSSGQIASQLSQNESAIPNLLDTFDAFQADYEKLNCNTLFHNESDVNAFSQHHYAAANKTSINTQNITLYQHLVVVINSTNVTILTNNSNNTCIEIATKLLVIKDQIKALKAAGTAAHNTTKAEHLTVSKTRNKTTHVVTKKTLPLLKEKRNTSKTKRVVTSLQMHQNYSLNRNDTDLKHLSSIIFSSTAAFARLKNITNVKCHLKNDTERLGEHNKMKNIHMYI